MSAIEKLVNETTDGSQKALEQLVEGFLDKFGEQGEIQRKAMDDASKGVGEALYSMNQTLEGFIHNLNQNQNASAQREQQLIEHISNQVDELVEKSSRHGKLLAAITKKQIEGIAETLDQSRQAQEAREVQLGQRFESVVAGMGEFIDRQTTASNSLIEQGKALQKQVEASQSGIETLAQDINAGASQLRSAANQIKEYGEGVRNATQKLGGIIQDAARSTVDLASENQKSATAVSKIHQQISSDIDALRGVVAKLDDVVQTADLTFRHLEDHQKRYLAALQENVKELAEQGSKLLNDYAQQANAQTAEHLGIWAQHTTQYANQMNQAAEALSSAVDDIQQKFG